MMRAGDRKQDINKCWPNSVIIYKSLLMLIYRSVVIAFKMHNNIFSRG